MKTECPWCGQEFDGVVKRDSHQEGCDQRPAHQVSGEQSFVAVPYEAVDWQDVPNGDEDSS